MIPVTKPYFPSREQLNKYIDGIYERQWLTNNGQLVQELTRRLEDYLGVENLLLVANGTLALQIAYRALGVSDSRVDQHPEAVTTPFTFVATASSLKWDGVEPVFADIDPETWCLNPANIEAAITRNTRAIVPVHVFGNSCDVEAIDAIACKHNLKIIHDASHVFGVQYKKESLLKHGDAATLSFHATKLFHTGEGGAIVFRYKEDLERAKKMVNFGITGPVTIEELGINGKMGELQAAMGLATLDSIDSIIFRRRALTEAYRRGLTGKVVFQKWSDDTTECAAYMPILLADARQTHRVCLRLNDSDVYPRRYFSPALHDITLFAHGARCPVATDIADRVLCLPLYADLEIAQVQRIVDLITDELACE